MVMINLQEANLQGRLTKKMTEVAYGHDIQHITKKLPTFCRKLPFF
jgi:hypothetical protein